MGRQTTLRWQKLALAKLSCFEDDLRISIED